jgi:hypothetical protein
MVLRAWCVDSGRVSMPMIMSKMFADEDFEREIGRLLRKIGSEKTRCSFTVCAGESRILKPSVQLIVRVGTDEGTGLVAYLKGEKYEVLAI